MAVTSVETRPRARLRGSLARRKATNAVAIGLMGVCVVLALVPLLSLLAYVIKAGASALSVKALVEAPAPSLEGGGGFGHAIVGSALLLAIAALVGIPWGVLTAIYLSEFARGRLGRLVRFFSDVLTGIPTLITGLVVYGLLVIGLGSFSALAGGVALALIMLPIITRASEEMLNLVPDSLREAGLALGMPKWKVILRIVLPTAAKGIVTANLLALARASGETAPLIVTVLGSNFFSTKLLGRPMAALPLYIFQNATQPDPVKRRLAWAATLVLILFILVLSLAARLVGRAGHDPE
ncbi:MAG TPA: phosphate ABC transporter permease PstA [Actinomycetes bacterium]|jgi:phosphate transport system permease protein|nr:phosphate ABC transporter permease PstA [Actinomycetes bacterium]